MEKQGTGRGAQTCRLAAGFGRQTIPGLSAEILYDRMFLEIGSDISRTKEEQERSNDILSSSSIQSPFLFSSLSASIPPHSFYSSEPAQLSLPPSSFASSGTAARDGQAAQCSSCGLHRAEQDMSLDLRSALALRYVDAHLREERQMG